MEEENREILFDSINVDYDSLYEDYCTDCTNFKEEPKDRYSEDFYEWVDAQQEDIYENLMNNIKASIYNNKRIGVDMQISSQGKVFSIFYKFASLYEAVLICIENSDKFKIKHYCDKLHIVVKYNDVTNYYELFVPYGEIKLNELNL